MGVRDRVGHRDELHDQGADLDTLTVGDDTHVRLGREAGLVDAVAGQAQRERRGVDRQGVVAQIADAVVIAEQVLDRARRGPRGRG